MSRQITRRLGLTGFSPFLVSLLMALLAVGVVAGCGLASATRINLATFYSPSTRDVDEEARATVHMKIHIQPWGTERAYAKVAASVRVGTATGVRWALRAATLGKSRRWSTSGPSDRAAGDLSGACS